MSVNLEEREASSFDTVCVIGLGYIGLPTAAFIASKDLNVIGVDIKQSFVDQINNGEVPFFEPDFESLLAGVVAKGKLKAQTETPEARAYIVAVPTPFTEGYKVDEKYIRAAAEGIAPKLKGGELVVLESTSPPGTTERMADYIIELRPDLTLEDGKENTIYIAHCPERVLPGRIMIEMATNARVIGGLTERGGELARDLYATFCDGEMLVTNAPTAEMAKLTENSFRDVNIAFANELSIISDKLGIDVWELIELANHHPRVNILQPGPGVGGHCIAVDPWFIVSAVPEEAKLIHQARLINDGKPQFVLNQVEEEVSKLDKPVVAFLGAAFKPDIDDLRESPALSIIQRFATDNPETDVRVVEPHIDELPGSLSNFKNITKQDLDGAIAESQVIVLLVDHSQFKALDKSVLDGKSVIDTKGIWR